MSFLNLAREAYFGVITMGWVYENEEEAEKELGELVDVIELAYEDRGWEGVCYAQELFKNAKFEEEANRMWKEYKKKLGIEERCE